MALKKKKQEDQHFKTVLMAHFILVLHLLLIVCMIFLVLFFHGVVLYMAWIFMGGLALVIASGYYFFRRAKRERTTLREILSSSQYQGRPIEINFLGGLASFKIGGSNKLLTPDRNLAGQSRQLEDPDSVRMREISELVHMLENNLITLEEYNKIKEQILKS